MLTWWVPSLANLANRAQLRPLLQESWGLWCGQYCPSGRKMLIGKQLLNKYYNMTCVVDEKGSRRGHFPAYITRAGLERRLS